MGNPSDYTLEYISEYINKKLKQIIQNSGPKYKKEKDPTIVGSATEKVLGFPIPP